MKISNLTLCLLCALALAACSDDDIVTQANETYTECFQAITDLTTGDYTLATGAKYTIEMRTVGTSYSELQLAMVGAAISPDISSTAFTLPWGRITVGNSNLYPLTMTADEMTTEIPASGVKMSDVVVRVLQRQGTTYDTDGNVSEINYLPVYTIEYTVDSSWRIAVLPMSSFFFAKTYSSDTADTDSSAFSTSSATYTVTLDPATSTGAIAITGAQFISTMPALNMTFPDIPMTIKDGNTVCLACDSLVPTIGGIPYPAYPIYDLSLEFAPNEPGTLTFQCQASTVGLFDVSAKMSDWPVN